MSVRQINRELELGDNNIDYITPTGLSAKTGHSADFHSLWLTWGFGLGKSETFVELTIEMKEDI